MSVNGPATQPASRKAAVGLLAAFLFVLPFSANAALRNALLALGSIAVVVAIAKGEGTRPRLPPGRVLAPILAYAAWCIFSIGWSVEPAYSAGELRPGLLYPFIAFLAFHAITQDPDGLDAWSWGLAASLGTLAVAAIAQVFLFGWWDPQRWHGDAGSYATFVVLAMPLLGWAFLRAGTGARVALAAAALLTFVVTSWNDNRIAWVALAAMTVLAVALLRRSLEGPRGKKVLVFTAAAMVAFAALFALSLEKRTAKLQGTEWAQEANLARDPRFAIWGYAAKRIEEAPWVGHGYGRGILRHDFRTGVVPGEDNPLYTHAHNTALNAVLQGGVVGLALFAWMVVAIVREMAAGLRADAPRRLAATLGLVLVAGFAIRNLTDDFLVRHNALLAWSLAGAVLGALRPASAATSARTPA